MGGIPGITHSSVWFGIDYYGKFYVASRASTSSSFNPTRLAA